MNYLDRCLKLAKSRKGFCSPNPAVGAVLVRDGKIIGEGTHFAAGHPHAEVEAIKFAGSDVRGATLYVSLEPCCHFGKTPPCTDLIIEKGISKVIFAFQDPNLLVAGKGKAVLEASHIECEQVSHPLTDRFYQSYAYWTREKKPWVTAKLALSLDGKIAGAGGTRVQLTGAEANLFTHQKRKESDAILTTYQTVISDNPRLDARIDDKTFPKPIFVLDHDSKTPRNSNIYQSATEVTLLNSEITAKGDWEKVLNTLGERGIQDLWVEAGGKCFETLHNSGYLNEAYLYFSPKWIGDKGVPGFYSSSFIDTAKEIRWKVLGQDVMAFLRY